MAVSYSQQAISSKVLLLQKPSVTDAGLFLFDTNIKPVPKPAVAAPLLPSGSFLRIDEHGNVLLTIHVILNAAKTQLGCLYGEVGQLALKVRLNAPAVDGKANDALIKWLADQLDVSRLSLEVVHEKISRRKQIRLSKETAARADWRPWNAFDVGVKITL